ncbi:MAG: PRTRC system ThiF family protein [Candidatus Acidiferrales bacterium]
METHRIHSALLERQVRVLVVGCGGTGSAIAGGLPYLHQAMIAAGHPRGLHVTLADGDTISPNNCVRQPFSRQEIGLYKCVVLVNRLNSFWGLNWEAIPADLTTASGISNTDIVIGCVDTRASRRILAELTQRHYGGVAYWLDIGNSRDSGQFVLGEPLNQVNRRSRTRLRTVAELYPEVTDGSLDDDGEPSCSALEALERQEPFVNAALAQRALGLVARLFRYGEISYHGGFMNLASGESAVLRADPTLWARMRRAGRKSATVKNQSSRRSSSARQRQASNPSTMR